MNQLTSLQVTAVEATLSNDEMSSDAELVEYFMSELGLSEDQASEWVAKRNEYIGRIR
jgi:hypothetical protein